MPFINAFNHTLKWLKTRKKEAFKRIKLRYALVENFKVIYTSPKQ
jgi:hypothetical protein